MVKLYWIEALKAPRNFLAYTFTLKATTRNKYISISTMHEVKESFKNYQIEENQAVDLKTRCELSPQIKVQQIRSLLHKY